MKKILILVIILLSGCSNYKTEELVNKIIIDDIDINEEYSIYSIKEDVKGLVLFEEYGRPDIYNSNTVIGAHSGYGNNAYFNFIHNLKEGDKIILYYDNRKYEYFVERVYNVKYSEINVLENKKYSSLTLITCNIFDSKERTIVISRLSG